MAHYTIKLKQIEIEHLKKIINKGRHSSQIIRAAYILLNCDKGEFSDNTDTKNSEICKILKVGERTIDRIKKKFIEEGFESVLERHSSNRNYTKKIDENIESQLVALYSVAPPQGFTKWSLRQLANKMVELNYIDYISHVSVSEILKKKNLSLGK